MVAEQSYDSQWNHHVLDETILTTIYQLLLMKPHEPGNCYQWMVDMNGLTTVD
jgi:hypothetical protein